MESVSASVTSTTAVRNILRPSFKVRCLSYESLDRSYTSALTDDWRCRESLIRPTTEAEHHRWQMLPPHRVCSDYCSEGPASTIVFLPVIDGMNLLPQ